MFALKEIDGLLVNVNPRAETHGDDKKPAMDLSISVTLPNSELSQFASDLRKCLYTSDDGPQGQLLEDSDHLTKRRFPHMGPVRWNVKGAGYVLTLHLGALNKKDIALVACVIDKFSIESMEGGSIKVRFRSIAHPNDHDSGRLCSMVQQPITISLQPPSAEEQAQMELDAEAEQAA